MTKIAEWVISSFPRLICQIGYKYRFSFDKTSVYIYHGRESSSKGIQFEKGFFHIFSREHDGAIMQATKYSESPEPIN